MEGTVNVASFGNIYYFIIIPIIAIVYVGYMFMKLKADKQRVAEWLKQNPNAAKVYIGKTDSFISMLFKAAERLTVSSVDGERPLLFREKLSLGFYVAPGTHIVESSFSKTRPGFFYRSVTTTYDSSKQEITVEAAKSYNYSFDKKAESYRFEELK